MTRRVLRTVSEAPISVAEVFLEDQYINIKSGDLIGYSTRKGSLLTKFLLEIVRILTKSEFSHVGIAWVENGKLLLLEAVPPVIHIGSLLSMGSFYHIPMNIQWEDNYDAFMLEHIGDKYSILDAIRGFFGYTNDRNDNWQCAELANKIYKEMGIDLNNAYTPAELIKAALIERDASITYINLDLEHLR